VGAGDWFDRRRSARRENCANGNCQSAITDPAPPRPGVPTHTFHDGRPPNTDDRAPTTVPAPTRTPGPMNTSAAIQTSSSNTIAAAPTASTA